MDINIPNNYSIQARPGDAAAMESQSTVDFHKHCQKTVCAAYSNGDGATWYIINNLTRAETSYFPDNWRTLFTGNNENITQDLAAILKLINNVAAKMRGDTTIKFEDNTTNALQVYTLAPGQQTNIKIGREVTLNINGAAAFKFHTLYNKTGGTYSYTLPTKTLSVTYGNSTVDSGNVYSSDDVTLDLSNANKTLTIQANGTTYGTISGLFTQNTTVNIPTMSDPNLIPAVAAGGAYGGTVKPNSAYHIYRMTVSNDFSLTIDMGNYSSKTDVISFEVHVLNVTASNHSLNQVTCDGYTIVPLTDYTTLGSGKINVYAFRCDNLAGRKRCTYSLAYIY